MDTLASDRVRRMHFRSSQYMVLLLPRSGNCRELSIYPAFWRIFAIEKLGEELGFAAVRRYNSPQRLKPPSCRDSLRLWFELSHDSEDVHDAKEKQQSKKHGAKGHPDGLQHHLSSEARAGQKIGLAATRSTRQPKESSECSVGSDGNLSSQGANSSGQARKSRAIRAMRVSRKRRNTRRKLGLLMAPEPIAACEGCTGKHSSSGTW